MKGSTNFQTFTQVCMVGSLSFLAACASKELVVKSQPADANVYLKGFDRKYFPEGKIKIGSTPLKTKDFAWVDKDGRKHTVAIDDVAGKEFYVIVEKQDFETTAIEAPPLYHDVKLPVIPKVEMTKTEIPADKLLAKVRFTSEPAGAKVYLDDEFIGNTPLDITKKPGKYQVRLSMPQHDDVKESITLNETESRTLNFPMQGPVIERKAAAVASSVKITSNPAGAEVFVNGELVGNTPYDLVRAPASYRLRLIHKDYVTKEETVSIVEGEARPIHIDMEKNHREVSQISTTEK